MRRVLTIALAGAALGLAAPASATALFVDQNGPDLTTAIHASSTDTANDTTFVYGCTQNNGQCANVQFEGLQANQITGEAIHITGGSCFASITDAGSGALYNLIMDPTPDFTDYEFTVQLVNDGAVSIYYLLTGGSGWTLASGSPILQAANEADQYILHGDGSTFSAIMISSTSPIFQVKQNSINLATSAVPEPGAWGLMLLGFAGIGMAVRRSRRRSARLLQIA